MAALAVRRGLGQALKQSLRSCSSAAVAPQPAMLGAPATAAVQLQQCRQIMYNRGVCSYCGAGSSCTRGKSTVATEAVEQSVPSIVSTLPGQHHTCKVIFSDNKIADFKYIWLRDNCKCSSCMDAGTKQKLLDTPSLDVNIRPKTVAINESGKMQIEWDQGEGHTSVYDPKWLFKYRQSFIHNTFEMDTADKNALQARAEPALWSRTDIWRSLPELSYKEFIGSDAGLRTWLDMFYKYGIAILREVPVRPLEVVDVVKRFAYVKETQYGQIFDVINDPREGTHLAYSGAALAYHTDMNYREKSPGMQLLHCLKAETRTATDKDSGGRSMFVDGFRAARWMEENEPTAFHVLTSTPVRFSIMNDGMPYSSTWPVICTNSDGDITEIHYNNRTMQTLQTPTHVVTPFYHAYKLFSGKLNEQSAGLEFNLVPGDLVAFNNRRVLHARSAYDATKVDRHLQGCYVDIDEAFSKYDQLLLSKDN